MTYYKLKICATRCIRFFCVTTFVFCSCFIFRATAQKIWVGSIRGGASIPKRLFGDAILNNGLGFEATIAYKIRSNISIYTGWGWNRFRTDKLFSFDNIVVLETGYKAGIQYTEPIGKSKFRYLFSGGVLYNRLEMEDLKATNINDSGYGFGWDLEGGIVFPIGKWISFTPTVRYHSLKRDLYHASIISTVELYYSSIGLKLSFLIWK